MLLVTNAKSMKNAAITALSDITRVGLLVYKKIKDWPEDQSKVRGAFAQKRLRTTGL